ncbi:hypothetical protein [Georgenia wangjunii]|uniref:hypothetical protein n=1 Tax=Georgenia wangjunii TaxID=3117730 RepID=UPI002F265467
METEPEDVRVARAVRGLRDALVACGAACLVLGVFAVGAVLLAGDDAGAAWPAVTLLGSGQLLALVGAGVAAAALRAVLRGSGPAPALARTHAILGLLARLVLVACVAGATAWVVARPGAALMTLALALVTAQLAAVLAVVRRRLAT